MKGGSIRDSSQRNKDAGSAGWGVSNAGQEAVEDTVALSGCRPS